MTFSQFLLIVRSRWRTVLLWFAITMGLIVLVSLVFPKKYRAEASVVLTVKPDPITGMMFSGLMSPGAVATQADIITSDRVARRVIHDLRLDQSPEIRAQWMQETDGEGTVEDWLVDLFSHQLDVLPSRESNVITITYKAVDPKFAAGLANAFAQAYLETATELKVDPAKQSSGFFQGKTAEARAKLDAATAKLGQFQRESGITGSDERLDVETNRLNDLSSQLVAIQTLQSDSTGRAQAAGGSADHLSDVLNNPVIGGIKIDLERAQANLKQLNQVLGPNHPSVKQAQANVDELEARLQSETRRVSASMGVSATINNSRVADLRAQVEAQRAKVLQLKAARDKVATLQHDVDVAQHNFETISDRLSATSLESQSTLDDISLLSAATPPVKAVFPRWGLNLAIGAVLGILLGLGAALLRELTDRRVRTTLDIVTATGLPILGILPSPVVKRKLVSLMAQRVISGRLSAPGSK